MRDDALALAGEEDDDSEDEADEAPRRDEADEPHLVVTFSDRAAEADSCDDGCEERDPEEDGDALGDGRIVDIDGPLRTADDPDVEECQRRKEDYLQETVECDEHGAVIAIPAREVRPDEDHGDAARDADEDEAFAEVGPVGEERPGEGGHEERGEDPV